MNIFKIMPAIGLAGLLSVSFADNKVEFSTKKSIAKINFATLRGLSTSMH